MVQTTKITQIQDFLSQLRDMEFGGTHDFDFQELEYQPGSSPKHTILEYYDTQYQEDSDSIYSFTTEYGIDMMEAPNWEDVLYQICLDFNIDSKYEEFLSYMEDLIGGDIQNAWQINPKRVTYPEDGYEFEESKFTDTLTTKWQDMLLQLDGRYFVLHFGVLE
jgi:hypothetical protein